MEKLNFEQMECVKGGNCGEEATVAFASLVSTVASAPSIFGLVLGGGLTAYSYYKYYQCLGIFG